MPYGDHWTMPFRARDGVFFGVCRGLAEHFNLSLFWFRVFAVLLLLFTGIWPTLIVYIILAFLMKKAPPALSMAPPPPVTPKETVDPEIAREREWDRRLYSGRQ